jgi:hypothetical protein
MQSPVLRYVQAAYDEPNARCCDVAERHRRAVISFQHLTPLHLSCCEYIVKKISEKPETEEKLHGDRQRNALEG